MNTKEGVCNASQLSVKRIILSIFFLLVLCRTAGAQDSQKATLTAADAGTCAATSTACLVIDIPSGSGGATFNIGANASANTIQFEASADYGVTWVALSVTPSSSTTTVTSTTSTGAWQANVAGYRKARIRCSTFVAGTIAAYINLSTASARSGGGGSGSVTHTAGNLTAGNVVIGNGAADVKVDSACVTNGTGALSGCTSISAGSGASAAGATATGGFACVEAASTGWTPTAGQTYLRCDTTLNNYAVSIPLNGATETPLPVFAAVPVGGKCTQTSGVAGLIVEATNACGTINLTFPVTAAGTTTSGCIPYFSSTTVLSSSTVCTGHRFLFMEGAGAAPTTLDQDSFISVTGAGLFNLENNASGDNFAFQNTSISSFLGTNDIYLAIAPVGGSAYSGIVDQGSVGLGLGTSGARPVVIAPNKTITSSFPSGGGQSYAGPAPAITLTGTTPYLNHSAALLQTVQCSFSLTTAQLTLAASPVNLCTITLPNAAVVWRVNCQGGWSVTAGTTPTFAVGNSWAQTPSGVFGAANIDTTNSGVGVEGTTSSTSNANILATGVLTPSATIFTTTWWTTFTGSATSGAYRPTASLTGTGATGTLVGFCTIQ